MMDNTMFFSRYILGCTGHRLSGGAWVAAMVFGAVIAYSVHAVASVHTSARESYVMDYETGAVPEKNGNIPMPPSSIAA